MKRSKTIISAILTLVMVVTMLPAISLNLTAPVRADAWDGTYTDNAGYYLHDDVLSLSDENAFAFFAKRVTDGEDTYAGITVELENDLDMGNVDFEGVGSTEHPFQGSFNGNGHTISNLKNPKAAVAGCFNAVSGTVVIENLNLENVQILGTAGSNHAALIGRAVSGTLTVQNCTVTTADIKGLGTLGALVGLSYARLYLTDCTASGITVTSTSGNGIGGMVGQAGTSAVTFSNCSFDGAVNAKGYGVGGMLGYAAVNCTFTDCITSGSLTSTSYQVGGILGTLHNNGQTTFTRCTNNAAVKGKEEIGGIEGYSNGRGYFYYCTNNGDITGTTSTADITVTSAAGILCNNEDDELVFDHCTNTGTIRGHRGSGGICGDAGGDGTANFTYCYNMGDIIDPSGRAAGICAWSHTDGSEKFYYCINYGNVNATSYCAGIVNTSEDDRGTVVDIYRCANFGKIYSNDGFDVGGIASEACGTTKESFNVGEVSRNSNSGYAVGGIVGASNGSETVTWCYNGGSIHTGNHVAGVGAYKVSGNSCYNYGSITDGKHCRGQVGGATHDGVASVSGNYLQNAQSSGGISSAQLKTLYVGATNSPFVLDTWNVNSGYPIHQWWRDEYFRFPIQLMDGDETVKEREFYNYNTAIEMPLLSKTGYVFQGWFTEAEGGTKVADGGDTFTAGVSAPTNTIALKTTTSEHKPYVESDTITLYAHFEPATTVVTLDGNGATAPGTASVTVGYDAEMPAYATAPRRVGYIFAGYYDAQSGGTQYYNADGTSAHLWDKEDAAYTLFAHWDPAEDTAFTVNHYYMDTSGNYPTTPDKVESKTGTTDAAVEHESLATTPPYGCMYNVDKSGFSSTIAPDGSTVINLYYYRDKYTVTFKDGAVVIGNPVQVYHGGDAQPPVMDPYKLYNETQHYRFVGWSESPVNVTGNLTVTARYIPEEHNWGPKNWTRLATCTDGGEYTQICTQCGKTRNISPSSSGHDLHYVDCGNGTHRIYCTKGDYELYEPHTFVDGICVCGAVETADGVTVTFKNWQGDVIQTIANVPKGATPMYTGGNAALKREETAAFSYEFDKWVQEDDPSKLLGPVNSDTVYIPVYTETAKTYTVIFLNWNGDVLGEEQVVYGASALDLAPTATKEDDRHTYVFTGWLPDLTHITKNTYAVAQFEATDAANWTVTFTDGEGTTLYTTRVADGEAVVYPYDSPEKEGCTFYCWDKDLSKVRADLTVNALFVPNAGEMVGVTFVNYNNVFLKADVIAKGATAVYDLADPTRPEDGTNAYAFIGWDKPLENVQENTVFTAQYEAQEMHPHAYTFVAQQDPDCASAGVKAHYTCDCGKVFDEDYKETSLIDLAIPAIAHRNKTFTEANAATCVAAGNIAYWSCPDCGKISANEAFTEIVTDVTTPVDLENGHLWAEIEYVWSDDNTAVTATRACLLDAAHNITETVTPVYAVVTPATLYTEGEAKYTATFTNPLFAPMSKTVVLPSLDPDWFAPTYEWSEDHATCTATRINKLDPTVTESETVTSVYGVVRDASCGKAGEAAYTATFTSAAFEAQTYTVELEALVHNYGAPVYTWSADNKTVTASMTCGNCGDVISETVTTTETVITPATEEAEGEATCTATFTNPAFASQTKTVVLPKVTPSDPGADPGNDPGNGSGSAIGGCRLLQWLIQLIKTLFSGLTRVCM